jgi:hypothetical protein
MIDGFGDIGTYIMGSIGVGTWPVLASAGSPTTLSPSYIGTGANFPYKIGTYNATGYNSDPNNLTSIYRWGEPIVASNIGVPGATANTLFTGAKTYSTPVSVGALAFPTAPNFLCLFSIIKY